MCNFVYGSSVCTGRSAESFSWVSDVKHLKGVITVNVCKTSMSD